MNQETYRQSEFARASDPSVAAGSRPNAISDTLKADVRGLSFWYDQFQALKNIDLPIAEKKVTALIGASGCGKSTLLRCFNRMHDLYPGNRYDGEIVLLPENQNIVDKGIDPIRVRLKAGMVFQKPNPFPKSIFENVASGLRVRGIRDRAVIAGRVEEVLREAALWDEVKDRLDQSAYALSGGQQQRLCIARTLAPEPELILLDEPTSALDPIATAKIEELIEKLRDHYAIVIVTHSMQQAARISAYCAFMHLGQLVEFGTNETIFTSPKEKRTQDYITGRFG
ncbi:phosphate ABC transporter ATP-binding protein [Pseudaminobacter arsenicus]|uniref:Phosphate ABC transporter ATP-binding protein n=1 Tax=Borborobacter arsenicus TaxID=1851146 RepID=A0A432V450_9HYPH|nr:phosphate ABC transporter ATP-binding protein [Pseudaminobacter arsenicus]